MFYNNWEALLKVIVVGIPAYFGLIILLRVFGKRTLSKLNAFDLVVTIALGSTLATAILSKQTSLTEALLAMFLLIGLQWLMSTLVINSKLFDKIVKAEPTMLFYNNRFLPHAMKKQRIEKDEILQAVRNSSLKSMDLVDAVVIETDGSISVIAKNNSESRSALSNIDMMANKNEK